MKKKNTTSGATENLDYRLPRTVIPNRYEIRLAPDLTTFHFSGQESIAVDVLEEVSEIKLNAKNLKIKKAWVSNDSGTTLLATVKLNRKTEMACLSFAGKLGKGAWKLHLTFTGVLNDKLRGLYRVKWMDAQGKERWFASSQFESTDARQAFPCFDEPDLKAVFSVKLEVDNRLVALSNGQTISETPVGSDKKLVEFTDSMKMSTYLVAFIIGDFVSSRPVFVDGIETRIWTLPGQEHLTEFALEQACRATAFLMKETGMRYPGKHINHVAIRNFASGAMENSGLITYRETALLCDPKTATHKEKKRVAEVVWHELAHNIHFGNTVTMRWWDGLCLNESFATFMENWGVSLEYPEWHIWEEFAVSRAAAMKLDSLHSTHPVEAPVKRPEDAEELFDLISYEKGCSLLYQLQQFIGPDNFRQGVARYIKKFAFGNTETHDLWDVIEEVCQGNGCDVPVRRVMDAWNYTAGHPVVTVAPAGNGFIELTQKPFKFLPDDLTSQTWPIPLTLKLKKADGQVEVRKFLFEGAVHREFVGDCRYVVVNAGGSGFYRVLYAAELLRKLTGNVADNLSVVERYNLVNDSWSCVRAGLMTSPEYLRMVSLFDQETDNNVWSLLASSLKTLHSLLPEAGQNTLSQVVRGLVKPVSDRLGQEPKSGETLADKQVRGLVFGIMGTLCDDQATHDRADELFARYLTDKSTLDSELVAAVVSVVAHAGDQNDYERFFALFKAAATPQEEQRYLSALSKFQSPDLLKRTLEQALNGAVRSQDAPYLVAEVMNNASASEHAWQFVKDNWQQMVKSYPDNGVTRMCGAVTVLDKPEHLADVKKFFAKRKVKGGAMAISQALEQQQINVLLRAREAAKLALHLAPTCKPA
jgi:puromycin-sensitive aminopeptidase